jgi:hypothetical protein
MAVPWVAIGALTGVFSAGSGIFSAGAKKHQAQVSSKIAMTQRRKAGMREIGQMKLGMALSGVEIAEPDVARGSVGSEGPGGATGIAGGTQGIHYDPGKKGFLGIGREEGGGIVGARDYTRATDTASIILGTSRDSIALDISAMKIDAANAAFAFTMEGFGAGMETLAAGMYAGKTFQDWLENN